MKNLHLTVLIFGLFLTSCQLQIPPLPLVASGGLEPRALQSSIEIGVADTSGNSVTQSRIGRLELINGHLPANVFAMQKTGIESLITNSNLLETSKKTELINSANTAFNQLETDINAALDAIPRRMTINPTSDRIGDLANANFLFQTKTGIPFVVVPSTTVIAVYNTANTDFRITLLGFIRSDGVQNTILSTIGGCQFSGALTKTIATYRTRLTS